MSKNNEILEGVLEEFEKLAAIPRQSKHEERVSDFLKKYLTALGCEVIQDRNKNIIAEIPASHGKENSPLTVLQAHMDMVCVAEKDYKYNPLTDSIKLVRTEDFLTAEGTSLGADDGIGIAEILYIVKNLHEEKINFSHGPLRIIFTTDEEQGMSGAMNLNKKYFSDATYLINCDSETYDELVVGSAGSIHINFSRKIRYVKPNEKFKRAIKIKISGLHGGHSGTDIDKNRANAIRSLRRMLQLIAEHGKYQLAYFNAGEVSNVIPNSAEAVIVTNLEGDTVSECGDIVKMHMQKIYGDEEPNVKIECIKTERPEKVLSDEDFENFKNLITVIHHGVYSLSQGCPPQIVSSANLAVVRMNEEKVIVEFFPRSNVYELLGEFVSTSSRIAKLSHFDITIGTPSPAWMPNPKSTLAKIVAEIFEKQNGRPMKIHSIHAGLECSIFLSKNTNLDIISIGTTNEFIHTTHERLHLKTVEPQVNLIIATLEKIAEQ